MILLYNKLISLYIVCILGVYLGKKKYLDNNAKEILSKLTVELFIPCAIMKGLVSNTNLLNMSENIKLFIMATFTFIVFYVLFFILCKLLKYDAMKQTISSFAATFNNAAMISYPIIESLFGKKYLLISVLFTIPMNLLFYTIGVCSMIKTGNASKKKRFSFKTMVNSGSIITGISLFIYLLKIKLPNFMLDSISIIADGSVIIGMLVLGVLLSEIEINFKKLIYEKGIIFTTMGKLILNPILAVLITRFIFGYTFSEMLCSVAILYATPSPIATVTMALIYDCDYEYGSKILFITYLFCIITIPAIVYLVKFIC